MADFEMYTDEVCAKAIESFQERLVEADNLMKDSNGMMNYEICWKAMRQEGPAILNVAKHLFTLHLQEKQMWENDMITDEDKAVIENG
jgi:hypothetical protein